MESYGGCGPWGRASQVTVYSIQPGRGFEQAALVLGADFAGFLVRDGWSIYRQFIHALHQTCLAHLLRRCREMILVARRREAELPRTIKTILQESLQLRDRRQQRQISEHGLAVARGRLEVRMDRTLERRYRSPQNRRLANHLLREREATLYVPELSRSGSDELASRTGHPPDGGDPQSLGRESNLARSAHAKHSRKHSANLPSATPLRFFYSSKADLCFSAQAFGLNCPYALNKY